VVVAGRAGTGKTTLARALARDLAAAYVRVDAIETALAAVRGSAVTGPDGYAVAHLVARSNLELGRNVVVDAVCPAPESRSAWGAGDGQVEVVVLETVLPDGAEHRRRVEDRKPDLAGQRVPTWADVEDDGYVRWEVERDGPRTTVDTTSADDALRSARRRLGIG
jgi:predicted kinase